jgi:hypothetical protein
MVERVFQIVVFALFHTDPKQRLHGIEEQLLATK